MRAPLAGRKATQGEARVGVLTFHRCINYGSYWQARCLVEGVRALGRDAVILDHNSRQINRMEWATALRPLGPARAPLIDPIRYAVKMLRFARARAALPRSRCFSLESPTRMESFDLVIVGSDEVWNLSHPWYNGCPLFFGVGLRTKRLVAYAASVGNLGEEPGLDQSRGDRLRGFAAISVRDENSRRIVSRAIGVEPGLVVDPCLLFPPRLEGSWRGPHEPFVAVYGHSFTEDFARRVKRWAAQRGYSLISIGYRNAWADRQWLSAGPLDFAQALARAQAVATNFFHGCVFALRHARPFVCEASPYRANKILGLLSMLEGDAHLVSNDTPPDVVDARLSRPPEPPVLRAIEAFRGQSRGFLVQALA